MLGLPSAKVAAFVKEKNSILSLFSLGLLIKLVFNMPYKPQLNKLVMQKTLRFLVQVVR
tara:strand:- start:244 stop:420 length:177 start_codon:yes stop_codon:yes gene_type:complete